MHRIGRGCVDERAVSVAVDSCGKQELGRSVVVLVSSWNELMCIGVSGTMNGVMKLLELGTWVALR